MFQLGNKLRKVHFYRLTSVWQETKPFKLVISRTTGSWIEFASHLVINLSVFLCRFHPEILHLEGKMKTKLNQAYLIQTMKIAKVWTGGNRGHSHLLRVFRRLFQVSLLSNSSRKVPYTYQTCLDTFLNFPRASFRNLNRLYESFVALTM